MTKKHIAIRAYVGEIRGRLEVISTMLQEAQSDDELHAILDQLALTARFFHSNADGWSEQAAKKAGER